MKREVCRDLRAALRLLAAAALLASVASPAAAQCDGLPGCVLVWSDEFDGTEVDLSKWTFQLGDGSEVGLPGGWGNNELQYYTEDNATVAGGLLTITAREESVVPGFDYTSTRLRSLAKGDWTFGRMEMRAKMPIGQGLWPAFWMLASDTSIYGTWAASGEIDIVEYLGSDPNRIFGTIHYGASFPGNVFSSTDYFLPSGTFNDDFHTFAVEWEFGEIRWYIDGVQYASRDSWFSTGGPFPAPFDVDFHLLLNLAVGGNLPGPPDATTVFPQEYVIDYVRVYQVPNDPPVVEITSPLTSDVLNPGDDITITVSATDDGSIQGVEFLQDAAKLGEDDTAPYEITVPNVAAGLLHPAGPRPGRRRGPGLGRAGGDHGRRRLPAGALPHDRGRDSRHDRGRELRPRRPGGGLQRHRRLQQRRCLPAGRGGRPRGYDRRRLRLQPRLDRAR